MSQLSSSEPLSEPRHKDRLVPPLVGREEFITKEFQKKKLFKFFDELWRSRRRRKSIRGQNKQKQIASFFKERKRRERRNEIK